MSLPSLREFKFVKKLNDLTDVYYYDIENEFETNPLEIVKSKIIIRLNTRKGEWKDDLDFGMPFEAIKDNSNDPDVMAQLVSEEILKVQYVIGLKVTTKDYNPSTRIFNVGFDVFTNFGTTNIEATI